MKDLDREAAFTWQGAWRSTSSWGCPQSTNDSQWSCWRDSVDNVRGTGVSVLEHTKLRNYKTEVNRRWNPVAGHESETGSVAGVAVFGPAKEKKSAEVLNSKQKRNQRRVKELAQKKGDGEVWSQKRANLWTAVSSVLGHDAPKEVDVLVALGKTLAFHNSGLLGPLAAFEVNTNVSAEHTQASESKGDWVDFASQHSNGSSWLGASVNHGRSDKQWNSEAGWERPTKDLDCKSGFSKYRKYAGNGGWGQWEDSAKRVPGAEFSVPGHTKRQKEETEEDWRLSPAAGYQCKTESSIGVAVSGPSSEAQVATEIATVRETPWVTERSQSSDNESGGNSESGQRWDAAVRVPGAGVSVSRHTKWQNKETEVDWFWSAAAGHQYQTESSTGVAVSGFSSEGQVAMEIATVWGRPWVLERSQFSNDESGLNKYMYCVQWGLLANADIRYENITSADEEETEEELWTRMCKNGSVLCGARIEQCSNGTYRITWRKGTASKWKGNTRIMLSRCRLEEREKKSLVIKERQGRSIILSKDSCMPYEFNKGEWNIFAATNDVQLQRMLSALWKVTTACTNPVQKLICDEPDTEADVHACNTFLMAEKVKEHVEQILSARFAGFNSSQRHAVFASLCRYICLIQGPPGTGKTTTASAIVYVNQLITNSVLASAPSNEAVDVLVMQCAKLEVPVLRAGRSVSTVYQSIVEPLCPERLMEKSLVGRCKEDGNAWKKRRNEALREQLNTNAAIVCSTCGYANSDPVMSLKEYAFVLVDEAAQTAEPEVLVPISRLQVKTGRLSLIGDHKQLPAISNNKMEKERWQRSLLERLYAVAGMTPLMLDIQYRMSEKIVAWPASEFYESKLQTAAALQNEDANVAGFPWPERSPIAFVHISGKEEQCGQSGVSFKNMEEVRMVDKIVRSLLVAGNMKPADIAVLTPYEAQCSCIRSALQEWENLGIFIASVEKAQGSERTVVVMSTVRCNSKGALGFVTCARRLNVCITRAKRGCIIVGNVVTLYYGDRENCWVSLLKYLSNQNAFLNEDLQHMDCQFDQRMTSRISASVQANSTVSVKVQSKMCGVKASLPNVSRCDAVRLLHVSRLSLERCLLENKFVFWLHWILRLPNPKQCRQQLPGDVTSWSLKDWSRITSRIRVDSSLNAGDLAYSGLATLLAHSVTIWHSSWCRLRKCLFLEGVSEDYASTEHEVNDAGDLIGAVAALFNPSAAASRFMQTMLGLSSTEATRINTSWQKAIQYMKLFFEMCGTSKAERMQFVVDCAKPVPMSFNFQNPTACSGFYNVPHPTDAGESKKTHTLSSAAQESVESEDHCREAWQKDLQRSARSQHGKGQCSGKRSIDTEQHNDNKCSKKSEKTKTMEACCSAASS